MHAPIHTRETGVHARLPGRDIRTEEPFGEPRISSVKISTCFLD